MQQPRCRNLSRNLAPTPRFCASSAPRCSHALFKRLPCRSRHAASAVLAFQQDAAAAAPATAVASPRQALQGTPLASARARLQSHYDTIVIGSGIGGMCAAAALSKFGRQRVLVLEQHSTAGGFSQVFSRGPWAWNVGIHYIGSGIGQPGGEAFPTFNALTGGDVAWLPLPDTYDRIIIGDRRYDFVRGREAWLDQMSGYFPSERQALKHVLQLAASTHESIRRLTMAKALPASLFQLSSPWSVQPLQPYMGLTARELIGSITQNKELQAVLCGQWMDLGLPPGSCSAVQQLGVLHHYIEGGYLPVGGASSITAALTRPVEAAGGAVVTCADVAQVLVRGGRAAGVRLVSGEEFTAANVVSTAGVNNTYARLLPQDVRQSQPRLQEQLQLADNIGPSVGNVMLYLGFSEGKLPEFSGLGNIHRHLSADLDGDFERSTRGIREPLGSVFMSCCDGRTEAGSSSGSGGESGGESGGFSTVQVGGPAAMDHFAPWQDSAWRRRGPDYQEVKQQLQQRLLDQLGQVFPSLPGRVAFAELSTPLSTQHFTRWGRGATYGLAARPAKYAANGGQGFGPRTPGVEGLFLAGADCLGGGVVPCMMSGVVTSLAVAGPGLALELGRQVQKWR